VTLFLLACVDFALHDAGVDAVKAMDKRSRRSADRGGSRRSANIRDLARIAVDEATVHSVRIN
jgi:hypothetical protein